MKKLFWFLFSFILLFWIWITNATTINFWLMEDTYWAGENIYFMNHEYDQFWYLNQLKLSTPFDLSWSFLYKKDVYLSDISQINHPTKFEIYGSKLFIWSQSKPTLKVFSLATPWDISDITYNTWFNKSSLYSFGYLNNWFNLYLFSFSSPSSVINSLNTSYSYDFSWVLSSTNFIFPEHRWSYFSEDWKYLYLNEWWKNFWYINYYILWTPFDLSTLWSINTSSLFDWTIDFSKDWLTLFHLDISNKLIKQYSCSTPYYSESCTTFEKQVDISGASYTPRYIYVWKYTDAIPQYSLFQTDFKTDKNLINLKFCWDYNNDDELFLVKWTTKFNWIKYWSCFEFGFVPSDTYILYLSWWWLKKLQDWSSFSISDWTITAFNTKKLDWQVETIIPSITSITYDETDYSYITIEVNGWLYPVVADPSKTIKLQWWNYSVSDWWYTYSFNFDKKIYFNSTITPLIVSNYTIWNKDIYLNWWPYQFDNLDYLWFTPECAGWVWFTGTQVDIIELTGHLYENLTWNVFIPLHEQFLTFFFAWTNAYIMWAVILTIVIILIRLARLWQRWRRRR